MPVIRWIMNHMVIIFIAVLAIAGAVYQDEIRMELSELSVGDGTQALNTEVVASTPAATPTPAPVPVAPSPTVVAKVVTADTPTTATTPKAVTVEAPVTIVATSEPTQMPTHLNTGSVASAPAPAPVQRPMPSAMPVAKSPPFGLQRPGIMPRSNANANARPDPFQNFYSPYNAHSRPMIQPDRRAMQQAPLDDKAREMWVAARTAFWQRDMAKAEKLYIELVQSSDEADAAGELGNVYYSQRQYDKAADMYYEAALRYLKGETPMRANMVVGPLSQIAPEKATEIRQKIREHFASAGRQTGQSGSGQ